MRKQLAAIAFVFGIFLAVSTVYAFAFRIGPSSAGGSASIVLEGELATQAALALFVDPTGNDSGPCTSIGTGACATIQGAWNKVPKQVRHPVTIDVAAGTYTGAYLDRVEIETAASPAAGATIQIRGTLANSTDLATGSATGTVTAFSGFGTGPIFPVITDSAATWTVNNLRGRFVTTTSGTGVGSVGVIISNTATTMTVAENVAPAGVGSGYAIQDAASIINTGVGFPATVGIALGTGASSAGFYINGAQSRTVRSSDSLDISSFRFTLAGRPIAYAGGSSFQAQKCQFRSTGTAAQISPLGQGSARWGITKSSFSLPVGGSGVGGSGGTQMSISNSYFLGGITSINLITGVGFASVSFSAIDCSAAGCIGISNQNHAMDIQGVKVDCGAATAGSNGILAQGYFTGRTGTSSTIILASTVNNCEAGIRIRGGTGINSGTSTSAIGGTGNTFGLVSEYGARVQINALHAMTGATADLQVEGSNYALSTLRALVPKRLTDINSGSTIFED